MKSWFSGKTRSHTTKFEGTTKKHLLIINITPLKEILLFLQLIIWG
jgi:hypothetical protein